MPFVFKFSGMLLLLSFAAGQSWLHGEAPRDAVQAARSAAAACPGMGPVGRMSSQWDVVRTTDRIHVRRISGLIGLSDGC